MWDAIGKAGEGIWRREEAKQRKKKTNGSLSAIAGVQTAKAQGQWPPPGFSPNSLQMLKNITPPPMDSIPPTGGIMRKWGLTGTQYYNPAVRDSMNQYIASVRHKRQNIEVPGLRRYDKEPFCRPGTVNPCGQTTKKPVFKGVKDTSIIPDYIYTAVDYRGNVQEYPMYPKPNTPMYTNTQAIDQDPQSKNLNLDKNSELLKYEDSYSGVHQRGGGFKNTKEGRQAQATRWGIKDYDDNSPEKVKKFIEAAKKMCEMSERCHPDWSKPKTEIKKTVKKPLDPNKLVDYMNINKMPSSKDDRTKLAKELNVIGYDLSGPKNIELLEAIKKDKQQKRYEKIYKSTEATQTTPKKEISIRKDDNVSKEIKPIKLSRTVHEKAYSETSLKDYNRKKAGGGKSRTEHKKVYSKKSLADHNEREAAKIAKANKAATDAAGITTKRKQTSVGNWISKTAERYGLSKAEAAKISNDKAIGKRIADLLANQNLDLAKDILKTLAKKKSLNRKKN